MLHVKLAEEMKEKFDVISFPDENLCWQNIPI